MKNLKIKSKLIVNASIMLFIIIILGGYSYLSITDIANNKAVLLEKNKSTQAYVLELRKHEKDFLLRELTDEEFFSTGQSKYYQKFQTSVEQLNTHLKEMRGFDTIQGSETMQIDLDKIESSISEYDMKFGDIVQAYYDRGYKDYGLPGKMRTSIYDLSDRTSGYNDLYLENLILTARKNEKDYMLRKDTKYHDNLVVNIAEMKQYINSMDITSSIKNQLKDDADVYLEAFEQILQADEYIGYSENEGIKGEYRAAVAKIQPLIDELDVGIKETIDADVNAVIRNMLILILVVIGLSIVLTIFITNSITKPMTSLMKVAESITNRDLDVSVEIDTRDEIGILAQNFGKMASNINDIMTTINSASDQVSSGSKQLADSSMMLSQGATEQASSLEELTASVEGIASKTRTNAESAKQVQVLSSETFAHAQEGEKEMENMLDSMLEIKESSDNISKIIKVIDDIAFQTNILALNAAVEAARAGEHGKGFAVVAEEVRNLAGRAASAAKETSLLIEGSIEKVGQGSEIANKTSVSLKKIVESINAVQELVVHIAESSQEQAESIDQVNEGLGQISDVVQTTSATAEETAAASEELSGQSNILSSQVKSFNLKKATNESVIQQQLEFRDESPQILLTENEFDKY